MFEYFQKLPNIYQSLILMASGFVLLLHTLGIVETGLNLLIILGAIYMIVCGFIKSGLYNRILLLLKRHRPPKDE